MAGRPASSLISRMTPDTVPERQDTDLAAFVLSSVSLIDAPLREIDAGWDFKVLILEGQWVLRMPRSARSVDELESEVRLLPALASALPVEIPRFEQVSREPWFVLYRLIRGEPLRDEDPAGVRAFLDALHGFDATGVEVHRPE